MPDITMCNGTGCPLKETCYRYKAKPNKYWQAYFIDPFIPYDYENKKCEYYWEIKNDG